MSVISIQVGFSPSTHTSSSIEQQQKSSEGGEKLGKKQNSRREFADELHSKLDKLAERMQTGAAIERKERWRMTAEDDDEDDLDPMATPERMCEWMRMERPSPSSATSAAAAAMAKHQHQQQQQQSLFLQNAGCWKQNYSQSSSSGFCSNESVQMPIPSSILSNGSAMKREGIEKSSPLVISYREFKGGPPFVVKIEPTKIISSAVNFRQFRRFFGIPIDPNKRFLFKERCEDESAPFQWRVIDEDGAILPLFNGQISAECRTLSDDDDTE